MKKEELNNYYFELTGRNLSISELETIVILETSATAFRYRINNDLPREYLQNALVWHDIIVIAFAYDYKINSGYRCPELNKIVGGVNTSLHQKALAVDFDVSAQPDCVHVGNFLNHVETFCLENNMRIKYHYRRNNMLHVELKYN